MAGPAHGQQVGIQIDASLAEAKIARMQAALTVRSFLQGIGSKELRWTTMNLKQAGKGEGGEPWAKMAPLTLRMRPLRTDAYHFSSPYQTLLQQSMVMVISEATSTVSIGTNAQYAREHHEGRPAKRLPARLLVSKPEGARARALAMVTAMIAKFEATVR